jgi:hypothetical protein
VSERLCKTAGESLPLSKAMLWAQDVDDGAYADPLDCLNKGAAFLQNLSDTMSIEGNGFLQMTSQ